MSAGYAPILVFGYKRLDKLKACIEALSKDELAKESELYIFADGYKGEKDKEDVEKVHEWVKTFACGQTNDVSCGAFKAVKTQIKEKNRGLANSIISGVTQVIESYGKVIVVEDDLIVTPGFLAYMNGGLEYYAGNNQIWAMASYGYNLKALKKYDHDVYYGYRASSWGWATWKDRWDTVDWEVKDFAGLEQSREMQDKFCRGGKDLYPMLQRQMRGESDSWAIRWNYAASRQDKLTVYPKIGLVSNDGFDGSGSHTGDRGSEARYFEHFGSAQKSSVVFENVGLDPRITREFYILHTDTLWKKIKRNASPKSFIQMIMRKISAK